MIKLLGADLDGTCLNSEVKVTEETRDALIKALDKGVVVVPTTGRTLSIVPEDIRTIPNLEYIITSSGAVIQNAKTGEVIYQQSVQKDLLDDIFSILDDYDLFLEIYHNGTSYVKEETLERLGDFLPDKNYWSLFTEESEALPEEELRELIYTKPVEKINFRISQQTVERRPEIFARLRKLPGLDIVDQSEGNGEITNADANKGEALAALSNRLGIDCSEVMTIGDSNNDISMLTFADTSIAMGQADENVKAAATYITSSNDENGVAEAINKFILEAESEPSLMSEEMAKQIRRANRRQVE